MFIFLDMWKFTHKKHVFAQARNKHLFQNDKDLHSTKNYFVNEKFDEKYKVDLECIIITYTCYIIV